MSAPVASFVHGGEAPDWQELRRELAVDPVLFEIIRHKLEAINEEQGIALKAVSSSPIVTEASDFNNGLYAADGSIVSMGPQVVLHSGAMPVVIRHVRDDCTDAPGIGDGDMFVVNDPYKGAVHHPDVSLVAPIHHEDRLIAWAGVAAHQVDLGGMSVGSISVTAREKQQEGLMMPPLKLVEGGVLREDLWRLILNMSRQPEMVGLDLKGFIASNVIARRRFGELIAEYGIELIELVMSELVRYSELRLRERLLELPDGVFRSQGFLDHDGVENRIYRTDIELTKAEDRLTFDFSDSSAQAPGFINCTEGALIGAVFGGAAPLLAADIPWNQGVLKAFEVIAPEGLVCNARDPAPTGSATIAEAWVCLNTVVHVTSKMLAASPEHRRRSTAVTNGAFDALFMGDRNQHGEGWGTQLMDAQIGGGGASFVADGIDQSGGYVTPKPSIPNVESNEASAPLLYLYRAFLRDSGGDGARRGGRAAGLAFTPYGVERIRCSLTTQGIEVPVSLGLGGGLPGACNTHTLLLGSDVLERLGAGDGCRDVESLRGERLELPAKTEEFRIHPGDVLEYTWAGGGGYGDPLDREPDEVVQDVRLGAISRERAAAVYEVVLEGEGAQLAATEKARRDARSARLARAQPPAIDGDQTVAGSGEGIGVGWALRLAGAPSNPRFACRCGRDLGPAAENWKLRSASLALEERKGLRLHAELELVMYLCPGCGVAHAVETRERGSRPVQDFALTGGRNHE